VIDTRVNMFRPKKKFRFEKWWLENDNFEDVVLKAWSTSCRENRAIDIWQFRVRTFRRLTRGWASNEVAAMNKEKPTLATKFSKLDAKVEQNTLIDIERDRSWQAKEHLGS
jgi:hypothetical protein